MLALTLWQPYASLVAHGLKPHETRLWAPPSKALGQTIAIHAAKRPVSIAGLPEGLVNLCREHGVEWLLERDKVVYGAVVATGRLSGYLHVQGYEGVDGHGMEHTYRQH